MNYLTTLGETLQVKLQGLPEAERAEAITFIKNEVLTSYRNGQKAPVRKPETQKDS